MKGQAELFSDAGGEVSGAIPNGHDGGELACGGECPGGLFGLFEPDGQGLIAPGVFELVTAIGGEDGLETDGAGDLGEASGLVSGGGGDDEDAAVGHLGSMINESGTQDARLITGRMEVMFPTCSRLARPLR
jgi:hypothetical protein